MYKELLVVIDRASQFGLLNEYVDSSKSYFENNEFELCLDIIITQIYEFDIEIDKDFFFLISQISKKMGLESDKYEFLGELVR